MPVLDLGAFSALAQVVLIDLVLAGDNAVAVALVAAGLPAAQRRRVIVIGIALAAVFRIVFALLTVQLLKIPGLLFVGGVLLLWIAWKLATELRAGHAGRSAADHGQPAGEPPAGKSMGQAMLQILIADVTMSLDNVLAIAAVARHHPLVLLIGLALAVVFMGVAASMIARLLDRHGWIAWVGVALIAWVGVVMVKEGGLELLELLALAPA